MRDDIAWVSIHEDLGGPDPFTTEQTDSLDAYQGIDGYPEATIDRTAGFSNANKVYAGISDLPASTMSNFLDYIAVNPSWATVNVNSTFDPATRNAVITVSGDNYMSLEFEDAPYFVTYLSADSKATHPKFYINSEVFERTHVVYRQTI